MGLRVDSVSDLPDSLQKQIYRKIAAEKHQATEKAKPAKYHNEKTARGEMTFDSQAEARRFDVLAQEIRAGAIDDLRLQPQFTLQESYITPSGERVRAIKYIADFSYRKGGQLVVEDVKSEITRKNKDYRLKVKMMADRYGIIVKEVL